MPRRSAAPLAWATVAVALCLALGTGTPTASAPLPVPPAGGDAEAPDGADADAPPRLAFTDDRDRLGVRTVRRQPSAGSRELDSVNAAALPLGFAEDGDSLHTGEVSSGRQGTYAFVRTSPGSPRGDVVLVETLREEQVGPDEDWAERLRVTCGDDAVETHPVVRRTGDEEAEVQVAYASDDGDGADLWVAYVDLGPEPGCDDVTRVRVTDHPADDLWPAWTPTGQLVFSSTRDDPLGDLYLVDVPPRPTDPDGDPDEEPDGDPEVADEAGLRRLTDAPAADTQPTTVATEWTEGDRPWVVFTTTRYRADGSLASLQVPEAPPEPEPGAEPPVEPPSAPVVAPLWPEGDAAGDEPLDRAVPSAWTPQSSEAQILQDASAVVFTSTRDDPYGDVLVTELQERFPEGTGPPDLVALRPRDPTPVAAEPGRSESHGGWLTGFESRDQSTREAAEVGFTVAALVADVSDVDAADGSGRRVVGATRVEAGGETYTFDDAGPAHSPDGARIAYSAKAPAGELGRFEGRRLVLADADGTDAEPLAYPRAPLDMDVDPVWSPDGTRLAFVRHPVVGEPEGQDDATYGPPEIWVADLDPDPPATDGPATDGPATDGPAASARRLSAAAAGELRHDVDPSWSPDGTRVVFSRQAVPLVDASVTLAADPPDVVPGGTTAVRVRVGVADGVAAVRVVVTVPGLFTPVHVLGGLPPGCEPGFGGAVCHVDSVDAAGREVVIPLLGQRAGTSEITARVVPVDGADPDPADDVATVRASVTDPVPVVAVTLEAPAEVTQFDAIEATATMTVTGRDTDAVLEVEIPEGLRETENGGAGIDGRCRYPDPEARDVLVCDVTLLAGGAPVAVDVPLFPGVPGPHELVATLTPAGGPAPARDAAVVTVLACCTEVPGVAPVAAFAAPATSLAGVRTALALPAPTAGAPSPVPVSAVTRAAPAPAPATALTRTAAPTARRGTAQIWTVGADGGGEVALTEPAPVCSPLLVCPPVPLAGRSPAWSPDGRWIALERGGAVHLARLAVASDPPAGDTPGGTAPADPPGGTPPGDLLGDPTGGPPPPASPDVPERVTALTQVTGLRPDGGATPSRALLSVTQDPAWSPDGTRIAVAGQPAGRPEQRGVYVLALTVDGAVLVPRAGAQGPGPETEPAFEPDATRPPPPPPSADLTVDLTVDAPRGWVGGTAITASVTVRNAGPSPAAAVVLALGAPPAVTLTPLPGGCPAPPDPCALGDLAPGAERVLAWSLAPVAAGAGEVLATGTTTTPDPVTPNTDRADLTVLQPTLRLVPGVGRPGTVVLASGADFPPGAAVELTWSAGVSTQPGPYTVSATGTLTRPVLIVRRDQLGDRSLVATSPDGQFGEVEADVLVVPRSVSPPDFLGRG